MSDNLAQAKISAARISVVSNAVLLVLKVAVGISIGSVSVLSEGMHSATDLLASFIAFIAVRVSDVPPDAEHPYGHGKVESVSGIIEALLIGGAGIFIIVDAVASLKGPVAHTPVGLGIGVMGLSMVVNIIVARRIFTIARRTESVALEADAHHLSIDVWTSASVMVGLILVSITGIHWIDPLVACVVGLFVMRTAVAITLEAASPLVDRQLPDDEVRAVEATMIFDPRILSWHKLRTRKAGSHRHIDVHIQVDDELSLRDAHTITEELEDRMRAALPNVHVMIHTEPYEEELRHQEEQPH